MKIKNKKKFIFYIILYCIGYVFFCLFLGGTGKGAILSWEFVSFFLILFILWQTDLENQKLNRTALLLEGLNILNSCLALAILTGISEGFSKGLFMVIMVLIVFAAIVGGSFLAYYRFLKWDGSLDQLDQYESFSDVITPEEFAKWQEKKKDRKERKTGKRDKYNQL